MTPEIVRAIFKGEMARLMAEQVITYRTEDNQPVIIFSTPLEDFTGVQMEVDFIAIDSSGATGISGGKLLKLYGRMGTTVIAGTQQLLGDDGSVLAVACELGYEDPNNIIITITGMADTLIDWKLKYKLLTVQATAL